MNDAQTQLNVGGGSLNATRNPQSIPAQSLGASPQTNLQSPNTTALSQPGLTITNVGSSQQLTPVQATAGTTADNNLSADTSTASPLIIGILAVLVLFVALVIWAVKTGQSDQREKSREKRVERKRAK